jgi:hypothetical protein
MLTFVAVACAACWDYCANWRSAGMGIGVVFFLPYR